MRKLRMRFWVESVLGALGLLLGLLTLWVPDWIERVTGDSPDAGSGAAEWTVAAGMLAFAVIAAVLARTEFARSRRALTT
jgi:hypothetical protein